MKRLFRNMDYTLFITPILIAAFGVIMVYSASMVTAVFEGLDSTFYLKRQLMWFVLGLIGFLFCSIFPYKHYEKLIKIIIFGSILLLIAVPIFGESAHNATRKIVIGPISVQPAEFVKVGLILYLASIYSKKQSYINDFFKGVLPPLIITALILGLVLLQPDIGTTSIIFLIACTIFLSAGIQWRHLLLLFLVGVIFLAFTIPNMVTEVRINRITGAYQPFENPLDDGYHLIQSYLAIGVGGLTGEGLGQSVQKLGYLWGAHTDFIMSIIAEELGAIGVIVTLGMLATIVLRGIYIARKCPDSFGALLAIGISSMIGIQAFINLGSVSGILPITGVPLPFLSYGGSSLLSCMIAVGILNNIAKHVKTHERKSREQNESTTYPKSLDQLGGRIWQN